MSAHGTIEQYRATLAYLRRCQQARAAGYPVSYTTDPAWPPQRPISPASWRASWSSRGSGASRRMCAMPDETTGRSARSQ